MKEKIKSILLNKVLLAVIYLAATVTASLQMLLLGGTTFGDAVYTRYNNYVVFRNSFWHLVHNQDLYILYLSEQWDLYKYSPSFALAMLPFAYMPDWLGVTLWSLLGMFVLFYGVSKLPFPLALTLAPLPEYRERGTSLMLWFILIEAVTATQSSQSNVLMAGLLILSFNALENKKTWLGTLLIVTTFFIKIYGLVALLLFFLYLEKRKFILYSLLWLIVIGLLPLIVISPSQLLFLYSSWLDLLRNDHTLSQGMSVMGVLDIWFHIELDKMFVALAGLILLAIPLIKTKAYTNLLFRTLFFSSILIWMIIFNHKAESSTFIIAVAGIALWYFFQKPNIIMRILFILAFIFTCLSTTDIFPPHLRSEIFHPYLVKVIPCIFIWIFVNYQLLSGKYELLER